MLLYLLITTQITIVFFSLYVHRGMAHQQFIIHPILAWIMRVWLWLMDGTGVREWVAIHHDHHKYSDKRGDPHISFVTGSTWDRIKFTTEIAYKSIVNGYKNFASKQDIELYTQHMPYDWTEKYQRYGILLLLSFNLMVFGAWGLLAWVIQISWVTVWMTVIVAVGAHHFGYQGKGSKDNSRNLLPFGLMASGEELHNNHHRDTSNPNLRRRWFEIDVGYLYLRIFEFFGLIKFKT